MSADQRTVAPPSPRRPRARKPATSSGARAAGRAGPPGGTVDRPAPRGGTASPPAPAGSAANRPGPAALSLLFRRARSGDADARDAVICAFLPMARKLARRYARGNDAEDLFQVACIGLVKSVDRFDPDRGLAFASYAVPTITGELKRYFRDHGWALHVPRSLQERSLEVEAAITRLSGLTGCSPAPAEVAAELECPIEDVVAAMLAGNARDAASLDAPLGDPAADGGAWLDMVGREDQSYDLVEYGAAIAPALEQLPERERLALHLRFVEDLTQTEIANRLGCSQMQVSRVLRRALEVLRAAADEDDVAAGRALTHV